MKYEVTKKRMRDNYHTIIRVGYCGLQCLLKYQNPIAYSHGVYGWACDYYELIGSEGQRVVISTGYSPIGEHPDYEIVRAYEAKAEKIRETGKSHEAIEKKINVLIKKFLKEVQS